MISLNRPEIQRAAAPLQKRRQEEYQEIHEELTKSQFELQEAFSKRKRGKPKFLMFQKSWQTTTYKMGPITSCR